MMLAEMAGVVENSSVNLLWKKLCTVCEIAGGKNVIGFELTKVLFNNSVS